MAKSKPSKNPSGSRGIATLLVIGIIGVAAFAAYVKFAPAEHLPEGMRKQDHLVSHNDADKVEVIKPSAKGTDLKFDHTDVPVETQEDPILKSVNGFLDKCPFVPKDARALSVEVKNHIAKIDFTNSFERTYGTTDEGALLHGLQLSMGQFKDVDKVIFAVQGHPIDSFGNVETTEGIPVIRPDGSEPSTPVSTQP